MTIVKQLTELQKDSLISQTYDGIRFFNPLLDANDKWIISLDEYNSITLVRANELGVISWWFTLPEIEYNPIITERPI